MATQTLKYLSPTQIRSFWEDGYLILPEFLNLDETRVLRNTVDVLTDWVQTHQHPDFQLEKDSKLFSIRKVTNIHRHGGAPWQALWQDERVLDIFEDILGPELMSHHTKLMMKPPFEGSAKVWHQDLPEGFVTHDEADRLRPLGTAFTPEQAPIVAMQLYLDDSTAENGCIEVVPGSHRLGLFVDPLDQSLVDQSKVVKAEIKAGGALLFHCLTFHYSAPNTSSKYRRAPVFEYMAPATVITPTTSKMNQDFGKVMRTRA